MATRLRQRAKNRGAAAVEFALVAPLFFMVVLGMVEFGRMVMVHQILTNASREGARVAIVDGSTTSDVETQVTDFLANASIDSATVTVTPDPPSTATFGQPVTVRVLVPYDDVSWVPAPFFLAGAEIEAVTVMRREGNP